MDIALESFSYDVIDEGLDIKAKFKKIFKAIIDKIIDVAKKFAAALKKLNQRFGKKKPSTKPEEVKPEPESKEATDDEIMKDILSNRLKIHTYSSLAMDEAIKLVKQKAGDIKLSNVYPELSKKRLDDVSAIIHDIESVLFDDLFGISVDKLKNEKDPIAYIIAASSRTLSKVEALGIGSMGNDDFASKLSDMVTGGTTHTLEECLQSEIYQYAIDQLRGFGFRPDMLEFAVSATNIHCDIYSRDSVGESIESGKAAMNKFVERLDDDSVAAADAVKQIVSKWSVVFAAMTTYYLKMAASVYEVTKEYIKIIDEAIVDVMTNNASVRHAIAEKYRGNSVTESYDFCNVR